MAVLMRKAVRVAVPVWVHALHVWPGLPNAAAGKLTLNASTERLTTIPSRAAFD